MTEVATKNWYIVHTYSGFENKVKESLLQRVQAYGLQNEIGEVLMRGDHVMLGYLNADDPGLGLYPSQQQRQ